MPILTKVIWNLIHVWKSDDYKQWTEKMMVDELKDLRNFYLLEKKKSPLKKTASFVLFVELLKQNDVLEIGNQIIDFSAINRIIGTWKHVTVTCTHFGRRWIAQDESNLECFKKINPYCDHFSTNCPEYEPMLKARSIEKLIKEEIEWSVS